MAATQIKPAVIVHGEENKVLLQMEFLIGSSSDLSGLPECAPGSVAYTADLSYMAMWDGSTWTKIGG